MVNVRVYIEGGGEGQFHDTLFRKGWRQFFIAAGLSGRLPAVVRGKGRAQTFDLFTTAVRGPRRDVLPLLLVDSEGPVTYGHSAWQHLRSRDGWERPSGAAEGQVFLMVQLMETWFLADRDLLRNYFGAALREAHIKQWPMLEAVPKDTIVETLDLVTAACRRPYSKGKVSYELLAKLNPHLVASACPHARALFDRLRDI